MRGRLGEDFVRVFTAVKRFELARFHTHITDWETAEYLELELKLEYSQTYSRISFKHLKSLLIEPCQEFDLLCRNLCTAVGVIRTRWTSRIASNSPPAIQRRTVRIGNGLSIEATPEQMRGALNDCSAAASAKFIMSLTGLFASILFTIALRVSMGRGWEPSTGSAPGWRSG